MFQQFDTEASPHHARARLAALRQKMAEKGLDIYLVPHADKYQGEYLPAYAQRLSRLTGFDGSAGFAIILPRQAVLFTDGRYHLQARQQTDAALFEYQDLVSMPPARRLSAYAQAEAAAGRLPAGGLSVGFDPWLHSIKQTEELRRQIAPHARLLPVAENLVDAVWPERPAPPQGEISLQPEALAGRAAAEKLAEIRAKTRAAGASACLLADPASVAWAFNIRGRDVAHNPVALGYALIPADAADKALLLMESANIPAAVRAALADLTEFAPQSAAAEHFGRYGAIMLDPSGSAEAFRLLAEKTGSAVISAENPVLLPRAVKTAAELAGARRAHLRDGAAMARFLAWLDKSCASSGAASLDEISAAEKLEELRRETAAAMGSRLEDISFDTISGAGANGAIIHYRVTRATNRAFRAGELYLADSGGQYQDGTTDITRTIAIGAPGEEEKCCFTLVLKGMTALSRACFPAGTRGRDLDCLARAPLWRHGLDYAHGTGHGVGSFLNVHEGPQTISRNGAQELLPGMIVSNEPGCYREGKFGIRTENLLAVREAAVPHGGALPMLSFETLTLCPIDKRLIAPALLEREEEAWLNAYHAEVHAKLAPHLATAEERAWLAQACAKL